MTKRRKAQRLTERPIPSAPAVTSTSKMSHGKPPAERPLNRFVKRFVESAIDKVFELFWLGVITVMAPIGVALWLYLKSGRATWVYPYLNFALGFICACLFLIVAASLLFYERARRSKAREQARNLKFASPEKGFIDFIVNKQKAEEELNIALLAINNVIVGLGKTASRFAAQLGPNTPFTQRQEITKKVAKEFDKHSDSLEQQLEMFERINNVLIESDTGFINWLDPANVEHQQVLVQQRKDFENVVLALRTSLPSIQSLRSSTESQKGMSQVLNTAGNRLIHMLDRLIAAMKKAGDHWQSLVKMIDEKV